MRLLLWDVLSVSTYALLRFYIGPEHAWPIVAVLCGICALNRDLDIHELVSVVYILRYACRTDSIDGAAALCAWIVVGIVSACAHTERYTTMDHVFRRACLFCTAILSIMVRYPWNTDASMSVCRLLIYTLYTRHTVGVLKHDTWDAAVQCVWFLAVPYYAYFVLVFPLGKAAYDQVIVRQSRITRSVYHDMV